MVRRVSNYTGPVMADMLRLNVAVAPPAQIAGRSRACWQATRAGFPNGRRVTDDVVTITVRMLAGGTYPWVDARYTPDGAASVVTDGVSRRVSGRYQSTFPYLGTPHSGFDAPSS